VLSLSSKFQLGYLHNDIPGSVIAKRHINNFLPFRYKVVIVLFWQRCPQCHKTFHTAFSTTIVHKSACKNATFSNFNDSSVSL